MGNDVVPEAIRGFIDENINSVEELETLLLLHTHPDMEWGATDISKELYTSIGAAKRRLAHLFAKGLAKRVGEQKYIYAPATAQTARIIGELALFYKARRVTIITLIYSKPSEQIRDFSDAFLFRQEEDDDENG